MEKIKTEVEIIDKDHIYVEGKQYVSLSRMSKIKSEQMEEMNMLSVKVEELTQENNAYRILLKDKLIKKDKED